MNLKSKFKENVKRLIVKVPYIGNAVKEYEDYCLDYIPGHYYSPIVSKVELREHLSEIFDVKQKEIAGIELNEDEQKHLLEEFLPFYKQIPFSEEKNEKHRYYLNNAFYNYHDAVNLYCMLRRYRPKQVIEAGSGFSSALMLDTNDLFLENSAKFTFIDPIPRRLYSLFKKTDYKTHQVLPERLQTVHLDVFKELNENDILFIDSTHVSKTGSDVNYILFQILPVLKKGVLIHFHDIFYPFEYPHEWVLHWNGFGWNECYALRSFLMYNPNFKILMFNTFMEKYHREWLKKNMPLTLINRGSLGGSIWIVKV